MRNNANTKACLYMHAQVVDLCVGSSVSADIGMCR